MSHQIKAVIDADFFRKATEYDRNVTLFLRMLDSLKVQPVMHEFVAQTELSRNPYLNQLLNDDKITVVHYADYLLNDADKEEYEEYFLDAFEKINRYNFPEGKNIYTYSDKEESLGEIRSLYMAMKKGYRYFMSDDVDSRVLAKNFFSQKHTVDVKTLYDVLVLCKENGTDLTWRDINPTASNAMNKNQEKLQKLKEMYSNQTDC